MNIDVGFGLWVCASGDLEQRLSDAIAGFAARYGGPAFSPHLTLAAGFRDVDTALKGAHTASLELAGLELCFDEVESTEEYYRALYLRANEHALLSACHDRMVEPGEQRDRPFIPHVSLFYGELAERRDAALSEARALVPLSMRPARIEVWELRGPLAAWRKRAQLPLAT